MVTYDSSSITPTRPTIHSTSIAQDFQPKSHQSTHTSPLSPPPPLPKLRQHDRLLSIQSIQAPPRRQAPCRGRSSSPQHHVRPRPARPWPTRPQRQLPATGASLPGTATGTSVPGTATAASIPKPAAAGSAAVSGWLSASTMNGKD